MPKPLLHRYPTPQGITAFSTTRHGGVGSGTYGEFNITDYCGDAPQAVAANLLALAEALQLPPARIVLPHQTHGTVVRQVAEDFFALSPTTRTMLLEGVDALITAEPQVCIGVSTADCIPVLLYHPHRRVAAAIHAGWRGTLQLICQQTIAQLHAAFHIDPTELHAIIGPGISVDHFEVGQEVYDQFANAGFDLTETAVWHDKWHLDLPGINRQQLIEAGIAAAHIQASGICTFAHPDDYFSARRLGIASGRIFTAIVMS